MSNYKEIVTKAVKSKCKKRFLNNFTVVCDQLPNTILGCWIINHQFKGNNNNGTVMVNGSFDINIWYSYDNNLKTGVATYTYNYNDLLNCNLDIGHNDEIVVKALKQPTVSNVSIKADGVNIDVEKELGVEIIGEDVVKLQVEDENDDYEEILDLSSEETIQEEYLD